MDLWDIFKSSSSSSYILGQPDPRIKISREKKERIREKIDEVINPESTAGGFIRKMRQMEDRKEEKEENRQRAPENLFHIGEKKDKFEKADHLFVRRGITHHAIYIGGGEVIHYSPNKEGIPEIHRATLEEFSEGLEIRCLSEKESPLKYTREKAVERAFSRLGEKDYNFIDNNCENFVRWCRSGGKEEVWVD